MVNLDQQIFQFSNFKEIIHTVLKTNPTPIPNQYFQFKFQIPEVQRVSMDNIGYQEDYEWLEAVPLNGRMQTLNENKSNQKLTIY